MIVGFPSKEARKMRDGIDAMIKGLGRAEEDSKTTIIQADVKRCDGKPLASYLIVRDSPVDNVERDAMWDLCNVLKKKFNVDVECDEIRGTIPMVR
jgi:hypothetical protein